MKTLIEWLNTLAILVAFIAILAAGVKTMPLNQNNSSGID